MNMLADGFADFALTALPAGESAACLSALLSGTPARGLRLRPAVTLDTVKACLPGAYAPIPWARDAHYLEAETAAGAHLLHAAGAYYLQEPSAMAAVSALDIRPGQRVLDLCAAPGGKSTQIAALLAGKGVLVANETVPSRAAVLSHNLERMGARGAIVTSETPQRLAARWPGWFDRVLVDAPCSGEGMFRRDPQARMQWSLALVKGCAARQAAILRSAARMLKPGGLLIYSTCTFNETENEGVLKAFLQAHPNFSPCVFDLPGIGAASGGCLRLWPHRVRGEGHFIARVRKGGEEGTNHSEKHAFSGGGISFSEVFTAFDGVQAEGTLLWAGDRLWLAPLDAPPLDGLRVLRNGLSVGARRGRVFRPEHAMAMAFAPEAFVQSLALDENDAAQYLRGETLPSNGLPLGWTVLAFRGLGIGWGKSTGGVIKNHLPKGLRRH